MSPFEAVSLILAFLALVLSLLAWLGQRKLQRQANALQEPTAKLSERQLNLIEQDAAEKARAKFSLSLVKENTSYRLLFQNIGQAIARDVEIASVGATKNEKLLVADEVDAKFPLERMEPDQQVRLTARVYMESPPAFRMRVRWRNPDGEVCEKEYVVSH